MYKLLIVDDEYEIRNGISQYFPWEEIGFSVVNHLEDGQLAYNYIRNNQVDVVLCDIKMPVMSGLDLAKLIHENYQHIRVIFLSGYQEFKYAQLALEYNVKNYILKSSKYNELIRVFTNLKNDLDQTNHADEQEDDNLLCEADFSFNERILHTIKEYIDKNYATVTLEDLTALVHMNPNYISKFFKQKTGRNFSDYLMEVRMKVATELLDDISYKTYEVSSLVGYSNSVNFTRTFKNYYGMSPREYRNRSKKDNTSSRKNNI